MEFQENPDSSVKTDILSELDAIKKELINFSGLNITSSLENPLLFWFNPLEGKEALTEFLNIIFNSQLSIQTVLEIGLAQGGTHILWKKIAKKVISIEISLCNVITTGYLLSKLNLFAGSHLVLGDSKAIATFMEIKEILAGQQVDMLYIDGEHHYGTCKSDHNCYELFVKPGGLIVFHDYYHPDCKGVRDFVDEIAPSRNMKFLNKGAGWAYYIKE